jgi:hypothetical protein
LNIEYLRNAINSNKTINKMMERHAAQAPALRERPPQIFNLQSSIPVYPGWVLANRKDQ